MQQRRVTSSGRPLGTDGSDFSYRMVVDSRYSRVAKGKLHLGRLFIIQAFFLIAHALLESLLVLKGDALNILGIFSAATCFFAVLIGESGRRHSRTNSLKIYMILSSIAMLTSVAYIFTSDHVLRILQGQVNYWEGQKEELFKYILIFAGSLTQIVSINTTNFLITNMSPPKRA